MLKKFRKTAKNISNRSNFKTRTWTRPGKTTSISGAVIKNLEGGAFLIPLTPLTSIDLI